MPTDDKTGCKLCSCSLSTVSRRRGVETRPNRFAISSLACRTTRFLRDGPHHPWFWLKPSAQALMASSKMKDCRRRMAESISDLWKAVIEGLKDCSVTINSSTGSEFWDQSKILGQMLRSWCWWRTKLWALSCSLSFVNGMLPDPYRTWTITTEALISGLHNVPAILSHETICHVLKSDLVEWRDCQSLLAG